MLYTSYANTIMTLPPIEGKQMFCVFRKGFEYIEQSSYAAKV